MSLDFHFAGQRGNFAINLRGSCATAGITAVLGPSGSGKTTFLRALAGLEKDLSKTLYWHGQDWSKVPTHKRGIAYVFQDPSLFSHLSVAQNIAYGRNRRGNAMSDERYHSIQTTLGIESLLKRRVHGLSGGEQQRVAIARALSSNPQLMLLDEPLANLDYQRKQQIMPLLRQLANDISVPMIYVTHSIEEAARLADNLLLLENGSISHYGPCQSLLCDLDLACAQRPDAESFLNGTTQQQDQHHHLTAINCGAQQLWVYAPHIQSNTHVRIRIRADDVSISKNRPSDSTILNVLPGIITQINEFSQAQVTLRLQYESSFFLARVSKKSLQELELATGEHVFAQIKSIAIYKQ